MSKTVAEFAYIRIATGFCYLAVILDTCSRKVVGYGSSNGVDTPLALAALHSALECRKPRPDVHIAGYETFADVAEHLPKFIEEVYNASGCIPPLATYRRQN